MVTQLEPGGQPIAVPLKAHDSSIQSEEQRFARAYAFSHSYRKNQDRAPLDEVRPPIYYKRRETSMRVSLPPVDTATLSQHMLAHTFQQQVRVEDPATGLRVNSESTSKAEATTPGEWLIRLSTLLYFSLGGTEIDLTGGLFQYVIHRPSPSPGCLYSSELYVYIPAQKDIAEGLYHYHGLHHDLSLLQQGTLPHLENALGFSLEHVEAVVFVGSDLWRIMRKYADFGYRLVSLEAGHLIGNVLLSASTLDFQAHVRYLFDDNLLADCLGLSDEEDAILGIVTLYRPDHVPDAGVLAAGIPETPHSQTSSAHLVEGYWHASSGMHMPQAARARLLEQAIRQEAPSLMHTFRQGNLSCGLFSTTKAQHYFGSEILLPAPAADQSFLSACKERNSGLHMPHGVAAHAQPVPLAVVSYMLKHILSPYIADLHRFFPAYPGDVRLLLLANRVENLQAGAYEVVPTKCGETALVQSTPGSYPLDIFAYRDSINCASLGFIWACVADYDAAIARYGSRAYRIVNMQAGLLAQRLCLLSAVQHLFARPFCAFDEHRMDSWLQMDQSAEQVIYTILCGYNRVKPFRFMFPV